MQPPSKRQSADSSSAGRAIFLETRLKNLLLISLGFALAMILVAGFYTFIPKQMIPPQYECGMRTKDGCILWFSRVGIDRYEAGMAGTATVEKIG